jgi:AcrR family transcriptional regulator
MMESKDRRVRRTHKLLGDALIELALEKEYDEITIQEITDRADVGYRTFFRHYADKDELLQDVISSVREEMRLLMEPPPIEILMNPNLQADELPDGQITVGLFNHVKENSNLYRVFLFSNRGLVQPLKGVAIQEFRRNYAKQVNTEIPFEIIANHIVASMVTLVRWWLENDMPYTPEEMGKYAFRLIIQPASQILFGEIANKDKP